ncbi:MAG: response regulator [Bacteroidetes bacterium]|nr:response regulator [Bacteroidota bacterium]
MDTEFLKRLLETFRIEAEEHIKNISEGLLEYEKSSDEKERSELVNLLFREAHSLKGAARAVNYSEIEGYCQTLETVIAKLRNGELQTSFKLIDDFHKGIDLIGTILNEEKEINKVHLSIKLDALGDELELLMGLDKNPKPPSNFSVTPTKSTKPVKKKSISQSEQIGEEVIKIEPVAQAKLQDTIRVSTKKMDTLFLKSEEMLSAKLEMDELQKHISGLNILMEDQNEIWDQLNSSLFLENSFNISDKALSLIDEYNTLRKNIKKEQDILTKKSTQNRRLFSTMVTSLVDEMKEVLMLPFSYLSDSFPKMVRELARDLNKEIDFELTGAGIEIDRRIMEEMKDAMVHLIRNCVDHGIETPEVRESGGKNRVGNIHLRVVKESGDKIMIELEDDGAGINYERIKKIAVSKGIYSEKEIENLSTDHLNDLLFNPDFSTSKVITDISGRGVGMSVVKEKVKQLNGSIKIQSELNKGTVFRALLPLSLAKIRAVIVRTADQIYALQTLNIESVFRINNSDIKSVENRESIKFKDKPIPLCRLNKILGIEESGIKETEFSNIIVINIADNKIAYKVDEILHEQEILIKKMNKQLERVRFINGVTILGDGKVIPVLNTFDLLKSAELQPVKRKMAPDEVSKKTRNLLIADDSITSRMLLRDILESAGFNVTMAVDGKEALIKLKENEYDLVVSDVEMPRLNGFELTRMIRKEKELKRIPVILLTALAQKEDREQGIDAGANAYIVKSGFDQSNLLDTIERLL